MKISVIIPSYKPSDYVFECLDSLYSQDFDHDNFEILFILNGCNTPYSEKIVNYNNIHNKDIDFRFFQTDVPGVSNARNIGIDNSDGEYITFIDDDDYVSNSYLSGLYESAIQNDSVSLSNAMAFDDESREMHETYFTRSYQDNNNLIITDIYKVREFFLSSCLKLIKREQIGNIRFNPDFRNSEDALFMFTISKNINKISFANQTTMYYRRVRPISANFRPRTKGEIIKNEAAVLIQMLRVWCHDPFKYNLFYTISKALAFGKRVLSKLFR